MRTTSVGRSADSMLRPVANTLNPASAKPIATPRPTPLLAPVTNAVCMRFVIVEVLKLFFLGNQCNPHIVSRIEIRPCGLLDRCRIDLLVQLRRIPNPCHVFPDLILTSDLSQQKPVLFAARLKLTLKCFFFVSDLLLRWSIRLQFFDFLEHAFQQNVDSLWITAELD